MKLNKIFLFATLAAGTLFTACSDDDKYDGPGQWDANAGYANVYFQETSYAESIDPTAPTEFTFQMYRHVQHEYTYGKDSEGNDSIIGDKIVTSLPAVTVKPTVKTNTDNVFTVSDAVFAEGDTVANVTATFPNASVGTPYTLKVALEGADYVSSYSSGVTYTYTVTRVKWNLLGTGTIEENYWIGETGNVEIYQRDDDPSEYRVMHPMDEMLASAAQKTDSWDPAEFTGHQAEYISLTVNKGGLVTYPEFNSGVFNLDYEAEMILMHPSGRASTADQSYWTYNKVLSYQEDGETPGQIQLAPWYFMYGVGGYNQTQKDNIIVITFPGFTPLYVASLENEDFDWEPVFTGITISEKLGETISGATLYKGVEKADLAAEEEGCYDRFYEEVGHPYIIDNPYGQGGQLLFAVDEDGAIVVPEDYESQATGIKALGDDVYASINAGKSSFADDIIVLNIKFTNKKGDVEYGTTNETFANITYTEVGKGVYTYGVDQLSQDAESFYEGTKEATLYRCDQIPGNYYLKPWAESKDGLQFTVQADNTIKFYQYTGEEFQNYGSVYFIDIEEYNPNYTDYLGKYDGEKTFEFNGIYYIPGAGGFGLITETFVLGAETPAAARHEAKKLKLNTKMKAAPRFVGKKVNAVEKKYARLGKIERL